MQMAKKPVVCLMGPTASGKTALACRWHDQAAGDRAGVRLISVDSALVYRRLDIGTAKPSKAEQARHPHALIDLIEPHDTYSVGMFLDDVAREIEASHALGLTPVLVGGTMMYFNALLHGLADGLPRADPHIRQDIEALAAQEGWTAVHAALQAVDPVTAARFLPSDRQRVLRALEVYRISGQPLSVWHAKQHTQPSGQNWPHDYRLFALLPEREGLHQRIAMRLTQMWQQGLLEEVQTLRQDPRLHADLPSMRAVGYRQVWAYLDQGDGAARTRAELEDRVLFATRQLAKRQYTWLRGLARTLPVQALDPNARAPMDFGAGA